MTTTGININSERSNRNNFYKRQIKFRFQSKRAEIIAWVMFFGIGVSYFVATLIIAAI